MEINDKGLQSLWVCYVNHDAFLQKSNCCSFTVIVHTIQFLLSNADTLIKTIMLELPTVTFHSFFIYDGVGSKSHSLLQRVIAHLIESSGGERALLFSCPERFNESIHLTHREYKTTKSQTSAIG